jgi:hypothetical protein
VASLGPAIYRPDFDDRCFETIGYRNGYVEGAFTAEILVAELAGKIAYLQYHQLAACKGAPEAAGPNFFCASNKSGKRSGDIQSNNAKQAVADRTEDGAAIPPQPFEPKPARDAVFR